MDNDTCEKCLEEGSTCQDHQSSAGSAGYDDSARLTWLIEHGAYGLIDHDSYPHTNLPELQDEARRRIDFEMNITSKS